MAEVGTLAGAPAPAPDTAVGFVAEGSNPANANRNETAEGSTDDINAATVKNGGGTTYTNKVT